MKHLITIIILLISFRVNSQDYGFNKRLVNPMTLQYVDTLKQYSSFTGSYSGIGGRKPKSYKTFERLLASSSNKELIELCKHPKPSIRYYAFHGLKTRNVPIETLIPIIKTHLNDISKIYVQWGCLISEEEVGEFMLKTLDKEHYQNHPKLKQEIQHLFLYKKGPLIQSAHSYLQTLPKSDRLYLRLQDMVKDENNPHALPILLSYNNPKDWIYIKYIIKGHPIIALKGMLQYPHKDFLKELQFLKTKTNEPYTNYETFESQPQDPHLIELIYQIYLKYDRRIRVENLTNIFHTKLGDDIKVLHALIIYRLLKNNSEEWTYPIKLAILPYLIDYDQIYIDELGGKYPNETLNILKSITTRHIPRFSNQGALSIINYIIKHDNTDSNEFTRSELEKDLHIKFFEIHLEKLSHHSPTPELKEYFIIKRLKSLLDSGQMESDESFQYLYKQFEDPKLKQQIWWTCYNYIKLKRETPIENTIFIMYLIDPEKTVNLCLNYLTTRALKLYPTWDIFNLLWRRYDKKIDAQLKNYYNNLPYSVRMSEFGIYLDQRFYPTKYSRSVQHFVSKRYTTRYPL